MGNLRLISSKRSLAKCKDYMRKDILHCLCAANQNPQNYDSFGTAI